MCRRHESQAHSIHAFLGQDATCLDLSTDMRREGGEARKLLKEACCIAAGVTFLVS